MDVDAAHAGRRHAGASGGRGAGADESGPAARVRRLSSFVLDAGAVLEKEPLFIRQLSAAQQKRATVAEPELVSDGPP